MSRAPRFWASALGAAALFALAAGLLLPYRALHLDSEAERWRAWLLTLWTGGVMAILFGAAALLGAASGIGMREVTEAGSMREALERRRIRQRSAGGGFHGNFAWWLVATGGALIAAYFLASNVG